ncbi:MAG: ABC-2 family transporter protein [Candidatus Falkowbacteria bacterium]
MKKYWLIFSNTVQTSAQYRVSLVSSIIGEGMSLVVLAYLWYSIYQQGNKIGTYSLSALVIYYAITRAIGLIIYSGDIGRTVGRSIELGSFSAFLLQPINFMFRHFAATLATASYRIIIFSAVGLLPIIYYWHFIIARLDKIILSLLLIFLGFVIYFLMFYSVGLAAFFIGSSMGPGLFLYSVYNVFSGRLIPIDLLPGYVKTIADWLPFKYSLFSPLALWQQAQPLSFFLHEALFALVWIGVLLLVSKLLYYRGLKSYEAFGN